MSKLYTETTKGLRDIFGFRDTFDIFLSCPFESSEKGNTKFAFYDKIGEVVRRIGKRPYLPHREINLQWPCEKIYTIPNSIVIPTSDVVLCYLGLPSTAAGIMLGSAVNNRIPIIYLFEKEEDFDSLKIRVDTHFLGIGMVDRGIVDTRKYGRGLEFGSVDMGNGNLKNLEDSLNRFYSQSSSTESS